MRDKSHKSAQLPDDVFKRQRVAVSSLVASELVSWIQREPLIAAGIQELLLGRRAGAVLHALASKSDLLPSTYQRLAEKGDDNTLYALVSNPDVSDEIFKNILVTGQSYTVRHIISQSEVFSPARREILITHPDESVRLQFATRADISSEEAARMFGQGSSMVDIALTRSIDLNSPVVKKILDSDDAQLLTALARRSDADEDFQLNLLEQAPIVIGSLSGVMGLSRKVLEVLFERDISDIAYNLSRQANLSEEEVLRLLEIGSTEISAYALRGVGLRVPLLREIVDGKYGYSAEVAAYSNPNMPVDMLREGLNSKVPAVLLKIAARNDIPEDLVDGLMGLESARLFRVLSHNPAVEMKLGYPVSYMRTTIEKRYDRVPAELKEMISKVDKSVWEVLYPDWSGTLEELLEVCDIFKAEI